MHDPSGTSAIRSTRIARPLPRRPIALAAAFAAVLAIVSVAGCRKSGQISSPEPPQADGAYGASAPFDPVAVNGPIFVDWPAPRLAMVFTGDQMGYLEPCGCAGLENQKGGLARRHRLLEELRERGWPVLAADVGGQIRRFGRQSEIKFHTTLDALQTMQYEAVGLGPADLGLPTEDLVAASTNLATGDESHLVSANVGLLGFDAGFTRRWRIVERGGVRVGIAAVLGARHLPGLAQLDEIETLPPAEALAEIVPQLEGQADVLVLLAYTDREEANELAGAFPQFDLVVVAEGGEEPPSQPLWANDEQTMIVEVGHKGMYAAVVGVAEADGPALVYQRVPLDSRFQPTPEMTTLMASYLDQLREAGFDGLGLQPIVHPRGHDGDAALGALAGSATCGECHTAAYAVWEKSKHAHATESLARLDPPRLVDPECVSCHTTGWNPQEYFPYTTGFWSTDETPHLVGNGCENCHGPGAAHTAAERARGAERDLVLRDRLRAQMRLTRLVAQEQVCERCHDLDNSPDFQFETYWPKVEHRGLK